VFNCFYKKITPPLFAVYVLTHFDTIFKCLKTVENALKERDFSRFTPVNFCKTEAVFHLFQIIVLFKFGILHPLPQNGRRIVKKYGNR